jgi:cyclophilin family peptidyl-prolyl cis-trans isomerase
VFAATRAPNSRSTQLFFNLVDNTASLDPQGFAPIGQVTQGMEAVDQFFGSYGDAPRGPDQNLMAEQGNAYIESHFPALDFIKKAAIQ